MGTFLNLQDRCHDQEGVYNYVFTSFNGCDSTVILTLDVLEIFDETMERSICEGESINFGWNCL